MVGSRPKAGFGGIQAQGRPRLRPGQAAGPWPKPAQAQAGPSCWALAQAEIYYNTCEPDVGGYWSQVEKKRGGPLQLLDLGLAWPGPSLGQAWLGSVGLGLVSGKGHDHARTLAKSSGMGFAGLGPAWPGPGLGLDLACGPWPGLGLGP